MAGLLNEISALSAELRSEKVTTRAKAAERLDVLLTSSKAEVVALFRIRNAAEGVSCSNLFNSAVDATIKHATKIDEEKNAKVSQTMRNKSYIYSTIVNKIIDYNLEEDNSFLPKSTILSAFIDGLTSQSAVNHFSALFLNLLDRGIYKSSTTVADLKVNEFSRILSYLFELNADNDENLRFATVRTITKTIELAADHVQVSSDLIDYLPEVLVFARKANDNRRKDDVIKLLYLIVSELSVDYHHTLCVELQELIPMMCSFYNFQMKPESKEILFDTISMSLHSIYPHIKNGDFNTFHITLTDNWPKTLKKLNTMLGTEIKDLGLTLNRLTQQPAKKMMYMQSFTKMAALVTYIIHWNSQLNANVQDDFSESRCKIAKPADKLEILIDLVKPHENEIWFAVLTEMLANNESIINHSNFSEVLQAILRVLREFIANENNLQHIRHCLAALLRKEREFVSSKQIPANSGQDVWPTIVDILISETMSSNKTITEKMLLLQELIAYKKLSVENCTTLLQLFMTNTTLRRTECVATVRQMLIYADSCGLDKTSELIERIINWCYETNHKINVNCVLLNIAPIDPALIADTCAIAVINFLNENQTFENVCENRTQNSKNLQLLYKYNRLFVCLEKHGKEARLLKIRNERTLNVVSDKQNCLFQANYELLMRVLNYTTTKETSCKDILLDLWPLQQMALTIRSFLQYGVFAEDNFTQCPLIKRIGFFFSHLELQLNSNNPCHCKLSDLQEILQRLQLIFNIFTTNAVLLQYLENQPLDELISFVGAALKLSVSQHLSNELEGGCNNLTFVCLKILAYLCASSSHIKDATAFIFKYKINIKKDVNMFLNLIEIMCSHKNVDASVAHWFVEKLKLTFKLHHTNIKIVDQIVNLLPVIFSYVEDFGEQLDNMLIALNSLLKLSFKKSYSERLTAKLIDTIRWIVHECKRICAQDDFINICLSVVNFISLPALEIQFATINTIAALIDANWLKYQSEANDTKHFEFAKKLIAHLDWKNLPTTTIDLKQNSSAVTVQTIVSLFVFSSHYQEIALQELSHFCARKKLSHNDIPALYDIATYFGCTLSEITKPYTANLVYNWTAKKFPIWKFPYFLCCQSNDEFFKENLDHFTTSILLYSNTEDLRKLYVFATETDLLKLSLPIIHAIRLRSKAECSEGQTLDFISYNETLCKNLNSLSIDVSVFENLPLDWKLIYYSLTFLDDENHLQKLFDLPYLTRHSKCFGLSFSSLQKCLSFYINNDTSAINPFATVITKCPLNMVHVLGALKNDCVRCLFPNDKLKHFQIYCTTVEMLIDAVPTIITSDAIKNCFKFFIRDVIFFILHLLKNDRRKGIQKCSLTFLDHVMRRIQFNVNGFCTEVIKTHLNEICNVLVSTAESTQHSDVMQLANDIMRYIVIENKEELSEEIALLDEFPKSERFALFAKVKSSLQHLREENYLPANIKYFLDMKKRDLESLKTLRHHIANNKSNLQVNDMLLYNLIKTLIGTVRNCENEQFNEEAAKCLGEIGSLKIQNISYYFYADVTLYDDHETHALDPLTSFVRSMLTALDKFLYTFETNTNQRLFQVAQLLINSQSGAKLVDSFPYFYVFCSRTNAKNCLDTYDSIDNINWIAALKSTEGLEFDKWICAFVGKIFKDCGWKDFEELAINDVYFADASLQPFIKLLMTRKEKHLKGLIKMLEYFFEEFTNASSNSGEDATLTKVVFREKRILSKFLNICECIRVYNEWKLPINLLQVAKACNYCQAYFMAIMYLELWAANTKFKSNDTSCNEIMANENFQESALMAYQSIGCNDAIAGFLNPLHSRREFLSLDNHWDDILLEASVSDIVSDELYTSILKRNGMIALAGSSKTKTAIDYEMCWRLCQWDTIVEGHAKVNTLNDMEQEFGKHHFNALKCLFNREENNTLAAISNARHCVLSILKEISVECLRSVYKYLTWLQLLQQAEDFCLVQFGKISSVSKIFEKWQTEVDLQYGSFLCKELILTHQITLFNTAGVRANRKIKEFYKHNPIENCLLKCIVECKKAGEISLTKRNIALLKNMELSSEPMKARVLLEDAEVCQKTGKPQITKAILQHVLKNKDFSYCLDRVRAFQMHGEYLMDSNSECFEIVLRKFFNHSLELMSDLNKSKEQILQIHPNIFDLEEFQEFERNNKKRAYETIARYADREFTQLNTYSNSDQFQTKCSIIMKNKEAADSVSKQNKDRDKNIGAVFMKKFAMLDEKEVLPIEQKKTQNLCLAIENYIKFCIIDESLSCSTIYRIIALWFANKQNDELLAKIGEQIVSVPSYKLICALNQITARLNSQNVEFLNILSALLVRCVQDHPYHTLFQLYPLIYELNDSTSNKNANDKNNNRIQIAMKILSEAKQSSNVSCMSQMECMFPALIDFANLSVGDSRNASIMLSDKLKRLKNLDAVQCPTMDLPVSVNKSYNITSIVKWHDKVSLVGGINVPKKLTCLCSDGVSRMQLLKGKDDLRQDAVMQQVFTMINDLMTQEPEATDCKLWLRTYKVVPLSMRSGILEWCENTIPIGVYLTMDGGAHKKYRPNDYLTTKCRQMAMIHLKSDMEKRYKVFERICENIKPVFHYFLLEKFLVPGIWFERRLAYTNSVATMSMVGYILGLGDRHTQNILIDEKTAEVVHIDFGIAFEQGKIMPTPETIPFRLTRDMVAPMGICETNGVFKKTCEKTMRILRRNHSVITTILEVLLYDPLYIWKVVPTVVATGEESAHERKNLPAQRALLCVQNKLEGKQTGILGTSSVEVQVQRLINDAISKRNLCMLYPGWDPYL